MLRRNKASRYNVTANVATIYGRNDLVAKYQKILDDNHAHALEYGEDMIK